VRQPKGSIPYLVAPLLICAATLLRLALQPWAGSSIPFSPYFAVALLMAWRFGFGPAAFTIALSVVAGGHYILARGTGHFLPVTDAGRAAMVGFSIVSFAATFLIDLQRRTLQRARLAEGEQKRANEELARVNRDLEAFAYSASHDLREPLRTISLSVDVIERDLGPRLHGDEARFLSYMRASTLRMMALLDGLLMYAKSGQSDVGPAQIIDADRLLGEVLESLRVPMSEAGATVTRRALPRVAIQDSHLAQVFQNLLTNAFKYGGKKVEIAAARKDGDWVFSVTDDGIGIEPEYAEQVFGLFARLDNRHEGSGVGLAICRRVLERYGGRVWLSHSKPGKGSTFCFSLPANQAQ